MTLIDLDQSVPELLIDHAPLLAVFKRLGIEYTCGGKSLQTACRERGLDPDHVARLCAEYLAQEQDASSLPDDGRLHPTD